MIPSPLLFSLSCRSVTSFIPLFFTGMGTGTHMHSQNDRPPACSHLCRNPTKHNARTLAPCINKAGQKLTDLLKSSIAVSSPNVQCRTQYPRPRCCRKAIDAPIRRSVMLMASRPCRACLSHLPLLDVHGPKASTSSLRLERMQPY